MSAFKNVSHVIFDMDGLLLGKYFGLHFLSIPYKFKLFFLVIIVLLVKTILTVLCDFFCFITKLLSFDVVTSVPPFVLHFLCYILR